VHSTKNFFTGKRKNKGLPGMQDAGRSKNETNARKGLSRYGGGRGGHNGNNLLAIKSYSRQKHSHIPKYYCIMDRK
jgi:hypothetical protein